VRVSKEQSASPSQFHLEVAHGEDFCSVQFSNFNSVVHGRYFYRRLCWSVGRDWDGFGGGFSSGFIGGGFSTIGRVLPFSPLKEPKLKPLIQYKRKGRKPKSAVDQGELEDVGFLRQGFLKSSSSSLPLADHGFSGGGCSNRAIPPNSTGSQAISPMEWSLFWSSIGSGDKGEEDKSVAFLSALDEEHRRRDKIKGCEL
jgi:hypothetical protein